MRIVNRFSRALLEGQKGAALELLMKYHAKIVADQHCLTTAAEVSDCEVLAKLLEFGAEINGCNLSFQTALCSAVANGKYDNAAFLLESGADPSLGFPCPLMQAVTPKDTKMRIRLCKLLLRFGADINQDSEELPGYNVLLEAKDAGDHELVDFLSENGAIDITEADDWEEPPVHVLDFSVLPSDLENAIRSCWEMINQQHPDETFCLFGLETDHDFVLLNPLVDSHSAIDSDKQRYGPKDSYIARISLDADSYWYGTGSEYFEDISSALNEYFFTDESDEEYYERKEKLLSICVETMSKLDSQGVFGSGADREKVLLFFSIMDGDEKEWKTMFDIARRLNPESVFKQFLASVRRI